MCTGMMGASAGLGLASSALSAFGQMQAGNAAASAAKYNAQVLDQQALAASTASRINEQQTYLQGDQLVGRAAAAQGANGVMLDSGSALQTRLDIQNRTNMNVANQTYDTATQGWGYRNQAALQTAQASSDQSAGLIGAAGTLIGGASQVSGKWAAYQAGQAGG